MNTTPTPDSTNPLNSANATVNEIDTDIAIGTASINAKMATVLRTWIDIFCCDGSHVSATVQAAINDTKTVLAGANTRYSGAESRRGQRLSRCGGMDRRLPGTRRTRD